MSSSLKSAERALLLALLDEKKLTRGRIGWQTRRRIFLCPTADVVIALGFAIEQPSLRPGQRTQLVPTQSGIDRARHERSMDLGRSADHWAKKAEAM